MAETGTARPTAWRGPVAAVILLQTAAAFILHSLPTTGPALIALHGWSESVIGYLMALAMASSIVFMLASGGAVHRFGPIRCVQVCLLVSAAGLALLPFATWTAPVATAVLIGFGYGPATPAASDILQRFSPPRHRAFIFSLKQAGVPLGGVAAGLLLPWLVTDYGWAGVTALTGAVAVAATLFAQVSRARSDLPRPSSGAPSTGRRRVRLVEPILTLRSGPGLPVLAGVGGCLAVTQGVFNAFLIAYLTIDLGLAFSVAGAVFSAMQAGGFIGRLAFGWVADRLGSGIAVVRIAAAGSIGSALVLSVAEPEWGTTILIGLGATIGIVGAGWNGVQLSEIARRSPPGAVSETAAGATTFVFAGFVCGPAGFGLALAQLGSFPAVLAGLAVVPALALALSFSVPRHTPNQGPSVFP
nr:MFS transporter [Amorphus coralli]